MRPRAHPVNSFKENIMQGFQQLIARGRQGANGVTSTGASLLRRFLGRLHGQAQPAPRVAVPPDAAAAGEAHVEAATTVPEETATEPEPLVTAPADVMYLAPAKRARAASVIGRKGITYGLMWLYVYPEQRIARRVLKLIDPHLAKRLKKQNFRFSDVPFDPVAGSTPLFEELREECQALLGARKIRIKEIPPQIAVLRRMPTGNPQGENCDSPFSPQPSRAVAKATQHEARPAATRPAVRGEAYEGVVILAGRTHRPSAEDGCCITFRLTLDDGSREIALFGSDLERQAIELRVSPGDWVRVTYLGRSTTAVPGRDGPALRNLYQVQRAAES
jgi:hypothetical protein